MSSLRPLLGALALTALLAARTMPDIAEELVLSAASTLAGPVFASAAPADASPATPSGPACAGTRP